MTENPELMLQRCVDGELSAAQRAQFLNEIERRGDWRKLALGFVENQVLAESFRDGPAPVPAARRRSWRRAPGPLTSVAAALCIGILSGFLAHAWNRSLRGPGAGPMVAQSSAPTDQSDREPRTAMAPAPPLHATPMMNVNLFGLREGQSQPMNIPVYTSEQWRSMPELEQSFVLTDEMRRELEAQGFIVEKERRWYRAPLKDGREILVPTEKVKLRYAVQ